MSEILESTDTMRVRLVQEDYPEAPYDDGASPILSLEFRHGWRAQHVTSMSSYVPSDLPDLLMALEQLGGDPDIFERYLRMFHGVTQVEWFDTRDGAQYVTFDLAEWRERVGAPEGSADMSEWRAYVEGDVYGYVIERRVTWHTDNDDFSDRDTWEEVDSCWGFYGHEYAEQAAREAFALEQAA